GSPIRSSGVTGPASSRCFWNRPARFPSRQSENLTTWSTRQRRPHCHQAPPSVVGSGPSSLSSLRRLTRTRRKQSRTPSTFLGPAIYEQRLAPQTTQLLIIHPPAGTAGNR